MTKTTSFVHIYRERRNKKDRALMSKSARKRSRKTQKFEHHGGGAINFLMDVETLPVGSSPMLLTGHNALV